MKKSLFTAFLATMLSLFTPLLAWADGSTIGFYVQGDIGLGNIRAKTDFKDFNSVSDLKTTYHDSSVLPRVSLGHDFGDWRVAGDYTHYAKVDTSSGDAKSETRAYGAGVSVIYDVPFVFSNVQPYVGARVSINNIKQQASSSNMVSKSNDTKFSPGVMAGVSYQFNRNMAFDAGYRYNHLDSKVKAHEATVGLRYTFR